MYYFIHKKETTIIYAVFWLALAPFTDMLGVVFLDHR